MLKRRVLTPELKARVALEELSGVKDESEMCWDYRLWLQVFSRWREDFWNEHPRSLLPNGAVVMSKNGFEHHVAMNASHSAAVLAEVFDTCPGWDVYWHRG